MVKVDASSGGGTITIVAGAICGSFNFTGFTGILAGSAALTVQGLSSSACALSGTMSNCTYSGAITFSAVGNNSLTAVWSITGGVTYNGLGTFQFLDAAVLNGPFTVSGGGTFTNTANNLPLSFTTFTASGSSTVIQLGSATYTISDSVSIASAVTVTPGTSTFAVSGGGTSTFDGGGHTYNNLHVGGELALVGANTFNDLSITGNFIFNQFLKFPASTTTTCTTFTVSGFPSRGTRLTLTSSTGAAAATLSVAAGTVAVDWADISWITATGGATFTATNSVDTGNNTGWTITGVRDSMMLAANF